MEPGTMYAQREKLWTERSNEEKLQALRECVLGLRTQMDDVLTQLAALEVHLHMPDGRIVRSLDKMNEAGLFQGRRYIPMGLRDKE